MLELDSVRFSYWRGDVEHRVLRGISLTVEAGDVVAVIGDRSAGKTTLLRVAAGFERPSSGRVLFQGRDLHALASRQRAQVYNRGIVWVAATGPLSDELSASQYVALPLRGLSAREARDHVRQALDRVGAQECSERRWPELTDSERIRVAIAQALVRRPKILIVDDPALGLGVTERDTVIGILRSAAERGGLGILMAVSDTTAALGGAPVALLTRGRLLGRTRQDSPGADVIGFPERR